VSVADDGSEKLNVLQMVKLGMSNPRELVQEVLRLPLK